MQILIKHSAVGHKSSMSCLADCNYGLSIATAAQLQATQRQGILPE